MKNRKKIYLLMGPKGAGKSFVGRLMNRYFRIRFIHIEERIKDIKKDQSPDDHSYLSEVFNAIEKIVREELNDHNELIFESTGLTEYFDQMHRRLIEDFDVSTIRVLATPDLCLKRIKQRDPSIHIPYSIDDIKKMNLQVSAKAFSCDFEIENENKSVDQLVLELEEIVKS